ncbi:hypothetical protein GIB67_029296 [Kingdonia uniflora]|uniref:Uncharacterized protein n=1 Tax=Kingdonia uniflora TaxID=39325 RepID=A0A7J7N8H7_9MAGN|nr:hypothetical protein GIB67_029296 [Kingdonia uniflora]
MEWEIEREKLCILIIISSFRNVVCYTRRNFARSTSASSASRVLAVKHWECGKGNYGLLNISSVFRFLCTNEASVSPTNPKRWFSFGVFHSVAPSFVLDQDNGHSGLLSVGKASDAEMGSSQVDAVVWLLYRAARSFSSSIKHCEMTRSSPELANVWVGVDVHA